MLLLLLALLSGSGHAAAAGTEAELVEAARREGALYVAGNQMIPNNLAIAAFAKKYPFLRIQRIDFEAVNPRFRFYQLFESDTPGERGDVFLRAQDKDTDEWIAQGWLAKLDDLPLWPERAIRDEPRPYFAYFAGIAHGLAYNPDLVAEKDLPKSYDDLLDPKWRGRFVIRSPLKGISVATFSSYIRDTRGIEWFRRLGANHPMVVQEYMDQHHLVQQGKFAFALSRDLEVSTYAVQLLAEKHEKSRVRFALLRDEVPYQYMLAAVNTRAAHPAAARLFVSFLISKEAEALFEGAGFSAGARRRSDLAHARSWIWNMSEVKDKYDYRSYVARALRELRKGGARIETVLRGGRKEIE